MSKPMIDGTRSTTVRWWWTTGVLTWLIPVVMTVAGVRMVAALGGEVPVTAPADAEISSYGLGLTLVYVGIGVLAVWVVLVLLLGRGNRASSEAKAVLVVVGFVVAIVCALIA
ncbi:hypothetical protein [Microbacterium azadirachtae]|uniref:Uncharacterized protein n=1 Tax=Microbacterium azadirachtae TaxID=582680 RepID=A0A1I6G5G1_9MICO|nr:hypothetical protein [Microbacterium azadirachtae]SDL34605.1 hypothetical protein SAMN04488593_0777 [Microbacterium azadirachtae]SEF65138.1 hypothetical protein SAMN04488594_0767 [Microbacterium azadirachtae]SEF65984.1 hypothetical protein SAMN04488592_0776 [Microbacterium azadirachtae]SFR37350.1 hypothetical protein SAMN04488591_0772 [Microbacterium azadirachtae]